MDDKKKNPYSLIWYKEGWSQNKINKNNLNYWDWERKNNGFVPPNSGLKKTVKTNQNK